MSHVSLPLRMRDHASGGGSKQVVCQKRKALLNCPKTNVYRYVYLAASAPIAAVRNLNKSQNDTLPPAYALICVS